LTLPELPYEEWRESKNTLHLWAQIVGKAKLGATAPQNHWWNVPLYVGVRGLTSGRLHKGDVSFTVDFDFIDHRLVFRTDRGEVDSFALVDGLTVAAFDRSFHRLLASFGVDVPIRERPFGLPVTTPFQDDESHARYQAEYVERFWRVLEFADQVFTEFAGWFCGKSSPVHLFWHSLDLAVTRFSGNRAPRNPDADTVNQEAYSHELISFGFWPGDDNVREASFYSYTALEPPGLRDQALAPRTARWTKQATGSLALLGYDHVRASSDPRGTLLAFLESGYQAGVHAAGWDASALASSFCPSPKQLELLLLH
jgi:hypothetical protein